MPSAKGLTSFEKMNEEKQDKEEEEEGKVKREALHYKNFMGYK